MRWLLAAAAGAAAGVLSAFGIGGGSLLLIYMTTLGGVEQKAAQGVNLLYFLPTAGAALPSHFRNDMVERGVLFPAITAGLAATAAAAWAATALQTDILRKCFGVFLLVVGTQQLFGKAKDG